MLDYAARDLPTGRVTPEALATILESLVAVIRHSAGVVIDVINPET